ncbi:AGE family epimerase/isomerase [Stenotrophomonas sp. MMGLT7]|uniref:AGE family epimerase/isomerase n=1 Tax=Stenotrophomonas sp. MMGLT7 TaxID=2901227 RepID=UPI001E32EB98|nr:AGE family epimerase/isomerase [Stenotrophomonas sp. MMGLT7]MCD7098375.1 AGE family epimerase/isomerase [Stenotrophomonas sp. MMGLT7]
MNLPAFPVPDLTRPENLRAHIADTMAFYHPRAIDPAGGFFQYLRDDGSIYDRSHRHLVSSTRFVYDYAMAAIEFADSPLAADYRAAAAHGVDYLRNVHRDAASGGYAWTLRDGVPEDRTNHSYGLAFVLLAYASARKAGLDTAAWMDETWEVLEAHAWDPEHGLYRDEADTHWHYGDYRGQNANMHLCEALIAAHEAGGDGRYLARALQLAEHMTQRQAARAGGLVWEHYRQDWSVDWDYHRDDPQHLFRPWGFQPGHQIEWAKLLLALRTHLGSQAPAWLLPTARRLYDAGLAHGWDDIHGGIVYGFAPQALRERSPGPDEAAPDVATAPMYVCDGDKYFWVQAEAIAAAWRLYRATGLDRYRDDYLRLWDYAWRHFVDHRYGAWYRILDRENHRHDDLKSPAGKTDYHTMGACHDVLAVIRGS